jgi:amino acid permease
MLDFIVNNYVIIMIIGAFLIFALIGFAVDSTKNKKNKGDELLTKPNDDANLEMLQESVNEEIKPDEVKSEVNTGENNIPEADSINLNMDN